MYKTIEIWLETLGASCGIEMCASDLCNHLLVDLEPQVNSVEVISLF